ncbi:Gamma-tubulin complex component 5 [Podila humilis]|nr:Gamma-tubulin complex component 5 [Podila humilis]
MSTRRQRTSLPAAARDLITHVTGFNPTLELHENCSNYVAAQLFDIDGIGGNRNKSVDHIVINQRIEGLADKFSMKSQETKSVALRDYLARLRSLAGALGQDMFKSETATTSTMDQEEAAQNVLSSVLLVLLELSESPSTQTKGVYGYSVPDHLRVTKVVQKTESEINKEVWRAILQEDPLVGDHWKKCDVEEQDDDNSDFEDMDVEERIVPTGTSLLEQDEEAKRQSDLSTFREWVSSSRPSSIENMSSNSLTKVLEQHQYWSGQKPKTRGALPIQQLNIESEYDFQDSTSVTHLSQGALRALLEPFLESAQTMSILQCEVDQICSASSVQYGKVILAFASSIHSELQELKKLLSDIQQSYQRYRKFTTQRMSSLMELQSTLQPFMRTTTILLDCWTGLSFTGPDSVPVQTCLRSTQLLSRLYENVQQSSLYGDTFCSNLFDRLLKQCMVPFLENMESWLAGQPLASEAEFMINPDVDRLSNDFWAHGFHYQTDIADCGTGDSTTVELAAIVPNFVTMETLHQVMYTGKAIRMTASLLPMESMPLFAPGFSSSFISKFMNIDNDASVCTSSQPTPARSGFQHLYQSITLHQYPLPLPACDVQRAQETTLTRSIEGGLLKVDFERSLEAEMSIAINALYQQSNTLLKSVLFSQSRLLWHLQGIAEFYFMLHGSTMHWFSMAIFSKVARECQWQYRSFVKIKTRTVENSKPRSRRMITTLCASTLEQVEFEYLLPWPLTAIVYRKEPIKQMFGRITTLLFQVKIAKAALDQPSLLKFKGPRNITLGHFRKLRLRFLSTVNDLWSYYMTTVLDSQMKQYHSAVENQGDLDDIIHLTQKTVSTCFERCFLKDRTRPLHRSIITILNLALKFSALFRSYIHDETTFKNSSQGASVPPSSPAVMRTHHSRSGRRVSFTVQDVPGTFTNNYSMGKELSSSESDEESAYEYGESGVEGRQSFVLSSFEVPNAPFFNQALQGLDEDGDKDGDEDDGDLDIDSRMFTSRAKRQRIGHDLSVVRQTFTSSAQGEGERDRFDTLPRSPRKKRPPQFMSKSPSRRQKSRSRSRTRAESQSTLERLQTIEREFTRCRDFLAKSLRVVVNSNAARGYNVSRRMAEEGGVWEGLGGGGEGGSDFLEGLILSLQS